MPGSLTYPPPRALFEDLPVEMYGKVASHTATADLIQLSRTSRVLFNCLAGPHTRPLWKDRISDPEGLPPCPAGMGEYHYLALVLLRACQCCSTGKVGTIDWDFKLRLCQPCWRRALTEFDEAWYPPCLTVFPCVKVRDIIAVCPPTPHGTAFVTADLVAIKDRLAKIPSDEQLGFIEQRKALMIGARTHARQCREWDRQFYAPIRAQRIPLIRAKLIAFGWRDKLDMLEDHFDQYRLVSDPVELTDSEWESLRPELEAHLLEESDKRGWKTHLCVDCPKSTRMFTVKGLEHHKLAKHPKPAGSDSQIL